LQDDDYPWAFYERESLEKLYQQCLVKLSEQYIEKKQFAKAERILTKAYLNSSYEEIITELLLRLYIVNGEKSKAVRHFNNYSRLLKDELGIKPNERIYKLFESAK
jgi:DNA-binding SARP family transcriptional activator